MPRFDFLRKRILIVIADVSRLGDPALGLSCPSKPDNGELNTCIEAGGTCVKVVDGFYPLSLGVSLSVSRPAPVALSLLMHPDTKRC
jgi:hypothetical protein